MCITYKNVKLRKREKKNDKWIAHIGAFRLQTRNAELQKAARKIDSGFSVSPIMRRYNHVKVLHWDRTVDLICSNA